MELLKPESLSTRIARRIINASARGLTDWLASPSLHDGGQRERLLLSKYSGLLCGVKKRLAVFFFHFEKSHCHNFADEKRMIADYSVCLR